MTLFWAFWVGATTPKNDKSYYAYAIFFIYSLFYDASIIALLWRLP